VVICVCARKTGRRKGQTGNYWLSRRVNRQLIRMCLYDATPMVSSVLSANKTGRAAAGIQRGTIVKVHLDRVWHHHPSFLPSWPWRLRQRQRHLRPNATSQMQNSGKILLPCPCEVTPIGKLSRSRRRLSAEKAGGK